MYNYLSHEQVYKKIKAENRNGWNTEAEDIVFIKNLKEFLEESSLKAGRIDNYLSGKVLEFGCGAGNILSSFLTKDSDFYGIDISPTAIDLAKARNKTQLKTINYQCGNIISDTFFENAYFDFILDSHCFHCIMGEDRQIFLNKAYQLLKKSGMMLISSMSGAFNLISEDLTYNKAEKIVYNKSMPIRHLAEDSELIEELKASNFNILNTKSIYREDPEDQDELMLLLIKE